MAGIFKTIIFMGISYFLFNYFFSDNSTEKIDGLVTKATDFVAPVIAPDTPPTTETESNPFALDEQSLTPAEQPSAPDNATLAPNGQPPVVLTDEMISGLTRPQDNAIRTAKEYLNMTGFSRDGLIEQLSSDYGSGYSVEDATIAVDRLNIDYNEQAVRTANTYLEMTGFSCKGLIEQLSSDEGEKYTKNQAAYGASRAGACS